LPRKFEIPILGKLFGEGEVLFLGRRPALLTADRGGAPPIAAVGALIDLNFAAENAVVGLDTHGGRGAAVE
jgi:hypothetical protein